MFLDVACPNEECEQYGRTGQGNIIGNGTYATKSGRVRKYICRTCGRVFCDRNNTMFYDLRTSEDKVVLALKLILKGMSQRSIAEVLEVCPKSVSTWLSRASGSEWSHNRNKIEQSGGTASRNGRTLVVSRKCCNFVTALYPIIITPRPSIDTFCP